MGYLDDEVKRLHTVIEQLEGRVKSLETRHLGGAPVSTEAIRMILIGPPGAGKFVAAPENALNSVQTSGRRMKLTSLDPFARQGNPGPQDQGEVLVLPSGKSIGRCHCFGCHATDC